MPRGVNRAKGWFRETKTRHRVFRVGVFLVGVGLVVGGATMWLVSTVLSLPVVFLGLWVWSREFHWGHRLFRAFLRWAESLWCRVRSHPVRWAILTVGGVGAAWAAYWAWGTTGFPA
jgi:hypothetical protein